MLKISDIALISFLLAAACVTSEPLPAPQAPQAMNHGPTIGQPLRFDLTANGEPLALRAVTGKITLICVLGPDDAAVAHACGEAQRRWGDRIAVVGLATSETFDPASIPFRVYRDPEGAELRERLALDPEPKVIVGDKRGRVARVFAPDDLAELHEALATLVG